MGKIKSISVVNLVSSLKGSTELAVIDPREEGDFKHAHLFCASNLPFSSLELTIRKLVPLKHTPIVLVDDTSGPAMRAGHLLMTMGYTNLSILQGGNAAWHAEGYPLFSGVNVPGKAFGEYIEKFLAPPAIQARELQDRIAANESILLIDTRTPAEHADYCIPGAQLCPNGDLPIRALHRIDQHDGIVVTHCAGRTRSIIGAQSLIDLGVQKPVFALENGTIAWEEIGAKLEKGANRLLPDHPESRVIGRQAVSRLNSDSPLSLLEEDEVICLQESQTRTTVLIDIRNPEDYANGQLKSSINVPAGQLIQNIDKYVVVRNARIVLIDDDGTRAQFAANWLGRMNYSDIAAHKIAPQSPDVIEAAHSPAAKLLDHEIVSNHLIIDCRTSLKYKRNHIRGSMFLTRACLERDTAELPSTKPIALIADDIEYANLMARDLKTLGFTVDAIYALPRNWESMTYQKETGFARLASPPNDMWYDAEHLDNPAQAMRENRRYIEWEKALIDDLKDEPSISYI